MTARIAGALRLAARAIAAAADAIDPSAPTGKRLAVEDAPADAEFAEFVEPGSEMAKADELIARMYLSRALRRYSPTRPASA